MIGPSNKSDTLFELYSKYKNQIDNGEVEILIDRETSGYEIIEKKTDETSLDIFQKLGIWFRTVLRLDRKIEKELVKMMDKEFKAMEKETDELSKKITKDVKDEALTDEINEKVTATLAKLESRKKELPIKEKYATPWKNITDKSKKLEDYRHSVVAYSKLVAKRELIKNTKTPEGKIKAINEYWDTMQSDLSKVSDPDLKNKFSATNQELNLQQVLASSKQELYENIESELNGLEKAFAEKKEEILTNPSASLNDLTKGLKEKIGALKDNDPNKANYEAQVQAFEQRIAEIDFESIINAQSFVQNWETATSNLKKEFSSTDQAVFLFRLKSLTLFLKHAEVVFNSPLGSAVQEKIGKDEINATLQSIQDTLSTENEGIQRQINQNNLRLQEIKRQQELGPRVISMHQKKAQEKLEELKNTVQNNLPDVKQALSDRQQVASNLKLRADQSAERLRSFADEDKAIKDKKEKVMDDYLATEEKGGMRNPDIIKNEFNRQYKTYQNEMAKIQKEIESQKLAEDKETVTLEQLLIPYRLEERVLADKMKNWQANQSGKAQAAFPEGIINLPDDIEKNQRDIMSLTKAVKARDVILKGNKGNYIRVMASLDKIAKEKPAHLEEEKMRHQSIEEQQAEVKQELSILQSVVKELEDAEKAQNSLIESGQKKTQHEADNKRLQEQINDKQKALAKLGGLKIA